LVDRVLKMVLFNAVEMEIILIQFRKTCR